MAPGCTSIVQEKHDNKQKIQHYENKNLKLDDFSIVEFDLTHTDTNSENTTNLITEINNYYVCYDEIYLDQIPLPSTPHPDDQTKTKSSLSEPTTQTVTNLSSYSMDTIDSFEILEQTIMKQKRLTKMKNSDLRLKVLLKRTFNLVCEIMDHENGFDTDPTEGLTAVIASNEVKETSQCVNEVYEDEDGDEANCEQDDTEKSSESDDETDDDEDDSSSSSDEDDYVQESINFHKVIPIKDIEDDTSNSQVEFQNIDLKEYNFYGLDQTLDINNQILYNNKNNSDDHYISLEPIVTYIEQQSISNKRKMSDDFEQDLFTKRFKSGRSLSSSSDDENDEKNSLEEDFNIEANSINCYLNHVKTTEPTTASSNETNFKLLIKSTETNGYKLASINFYA